MACITLRHETSRQLFRYKTFAVEHTRNVACVLGVRWRGEYRSRKCVACGGTVGAVAEGVWMRDGWRISEREDVDLRNLIPGPYT